MYCDAVPWRVPEHSTSSREVCAPDRSYFQLCVTKYLFKKTLRFN
jgi:hypothetical protein